MYPKVLVNITKLKANLTYLNSLCDQFGITSRFLVTKVLAGNVEIIEALMPCGFTHLADSRIANLKLMQSLPYPKVLLRLPSPSEIDDVVKYADLSLNSELSTIISLNEAAKKQKKKHQIILMFDLGDLREGIFYQDDYFPLLEQIIPLSNIELVGIGTNLTCYGGIIPSVEHFETLLKIKESIVKRYQINLSIISGGNSSTIPLVQKGLLPKGINNLRLGEAVFLGRETAYGKAIPTMHQDAFLLYAEIIEIQTKPSYPLGEIGMNSFGEKPTFIDYGLMKRAIIALGKQDIQIDNLTPIDSNITILGGSSDHLIIDITKSNYQVGDILCFKLNYPGLLQIMTSNYVKKGLEK